MGAVPAAARVTVPPKPIEQSIPLASIVPSPTNPRRYFDEAKLAELAASILEKGVLQAILVRPRFDKGTKQSAKNHGISVPTSAYELVAGERRFRAAKLAGLAEIPARVVELTDREVLEIQVIENDQRADVTDLERSDAYHRLINDHKVSVTEIAQRVGKSEATIRSVLKLQELPEKARKALEVGTINSAVAQVIATRPTHKMREEVTKYALTETNSWNYEEQRLIKGLPSFRDVKSFVRERLMVPLHQAPFDTNKAFDRFPDCSLCPNRTGNNRAEYPDARPDVCTLPSCFDAKAKAWQDRTLAEAKAAGQTIMPKAESKKLYPYGSHLSSSDWVELTSKCHELDKPKEWAKLLKPHLAHSQIVIAFDNAGGLHQIVKRSDAMKILRDHHGLKQQSSGGDSRKDDAFSREQAKQRKEALARRQAAYEANRIVAEKAQSAFTSGLLGCDASTKELLRAIVMTLPEILWSDACHDVCKRRGLEGDKRQAVEDLAKSLQRANELMGLAAELVAARLSHGWSSEYFNGQAGKDNPFWQAFGIDPVKLRKQHVTESASKAKAKASPKERKSRPAKVEFSVSEEDAELANLEVATVDAPSRSLSDIGVSIEKLRNSQLRPLFESRWPDQGPSTVRPFLADGTLWVAASGPPEWICLPLISQSLFEGKFPDRELRLEPSMQIEPETIYFGVRVNHEGLEWIIGPRSLGMLVSADEAKNAESTEKPYAWDVEIELHDGTKVRKTYVAPNEKQARRNAMLTSKAREITSIESMTEKQYHAVHGFGRRSMSTKTSHSS